MNPLESIKEAPQEAIAIGKKYMQKTEAYYKLKIFEQLTISASALTKLLIIGGFVFIGFIYLTIASTIALAKLLGSLEYACLIIALITFIFGLIAYKLKSHIDSKVIKSISKSFF